MHSAFLSLSHLYTTDILLTIHLFILNTSDTLRQCVSALQPYFIYLSSDSNKGPITCYNWLCNTWRLTLLCVSNHRVALQDTLASTCSAVFTSENNLSQSRTRFGPLTCCEGFAVFICQWVFCTSAQTLLCLFFCVSSVLVFRLFAHIFAALRRWTQRCMCASDGRWPSWVCRCPAVVSFLRSLCLPLGQSLDCTVNI